MDPTSELRLKDRLKTISQGKTTILITHKGAMLDLVDKLILMDRGRMIAFGPRDEIIRRLQAREFGGGGSSGRPAASSAKTQSQQGGTHGQS